MQYTREIAVLIEFDDTWGRNVVEAISRYAQEANWRLLLGPKDSQRRLRLPADWKGDGLIVLLRDQSMIDHVRAFEVPTVNVGGLYLDQDWCGLVATDDDGRAEMAFQHFRQRQIEHFAYYAPSIGRYPLKRAEAFRKAVVDAGYYCEQFSCHETTENHAESSSEETLGSWLKNLRRPIGIFASDPYPARRLMDLCWKMNIDVPGDIAILSGDEDELLCKLISPMISSVELASHRIGHEACMMLDSMIHTKCLPERPQLLQPLRICSRRSTENVAIDDPALREVVQQIWEKAPDGIQIQDLVRHSAMSRRSLEQKFRKTLGRTVAEEIRRVRLEKARQLVVTTSQSVAAIALATGFSSGPYLTHAFRKYYGLTPSALRIGRKDQDVRSPLSNGKVR